MKALSKFLYIQKKMYHLKKKAKFSFDDIKFYSETFKKSLIITSKLNTMVKIISENQR